VICRHNLANGTCRRCYPKTGLVDPGLEDDYESTLEGPGAVPLEVYRKRAVAIRGETAKDGPRVAVPGPGDQILVKAKTLCGVRYSMKVTVVGNEYVVCGDGMGTMTAKISDYGESWWWPRCPPQLAENEI